MKALTELLLHTKPLHLVLALALTRSLTPRTLLLTHSPNSSLAHTCGSWESREESQHARASRHQMVKWRLLFLLAFICI